MPSEKKAAVFLDQTQARLITLQQGIAGFDRTIESHFESHPRYRGEGSDQARFGSDPYHGSNNEFRKNRQEEEIRKKYFNQLREALLPYDEILLFGPGETKKELYNYLNKEYAFQSKIMLLQNSGHRTDPQLLETVRDCFSLTA